jgi:bacterial/archaeal transporter family-2 protein
VISALVVYAGGRLGVLATAPFIGKSAGALMVNASSVPWWARIGGLMASVYVVATLTVSKGMGAGAFTAVTLTAAVVTSLALDHYGLLGFDVHPINWPRVASGTLMIVCVTLVAMR